MCFTYSGKITYFYVSILLIRNNYGTHFCVLLFICFWATAHGPRRNRQKQPLIIIGKNWCDLYSKAVFFIHIIKFYQWKNSDFINFKAIKRILINRHSFKNLELFSYDIMRFKYVCIDYISWSRTFVQPHKKYFKTNWRNLKYDYLNKF